MKIIKFPCQLKLALIVLFCLGAHSAATNTLVKTHNDVTFNCIEDEPLKYFCTNVPVINPTFILKLSRLERKKISRYVNAFRIMPSLTNQTNKTIRSAEIQLKFWGNPKLSKSFIINQKLIPNSQSHTKLSYLIRSDVPAQAPLYNELLTISKNASYDQVILEISKVNYQK